MFQTESLLRSVAFCGCDAGAIRTAWSSCLCGPLQRIGGGLTAGPVEQKPSIMHHGELCTRDIVGLISLWTSDMTFETRQAASMQTG